ncbi:MAG: hypothetical protein HY927_13730 [Elusimicrobia bacterium]|nr:hypothetical protein [Elusimicrobiota bacterium]
MPIFKINLADFDNLLQSEPAKLSDQELLSLDFILHRAWEMLAAGQQMFQDGQPWTFQALQMSPPADDFSAA